MQPRKTDHAGSIRFKQWASSTYQSPELEPTSEKSPSCLNHPLLLSDKKLEHLLGRLRAIKHVEFIRIGSRIPVFLPQRITPELCEIFKKHGPIWMSIHVNHPKEATQELKDACERLARMLAPKQPSLNVRRRAMADSRRGCR